MLAPIVMFVYNRADRVKALTESLGKNKEAKESVLYIFSDGAKNENGQERVNQVRAYIDTIPQMELFRQVIVKKAPGNRGLAKSIIAGVDEVIQKHGRAIIIEDDNIVAPDFLDYMNRGLDYYESDSKIWSISGFARKMQMPVDYKHDVFILQRMSSYTWATWKDRWEKTEWEMKQYPGFLWDAKARKAFDRYGEDRSLMLDAQACGRINSWAIRFEYSMMKNDMYSVFPVVSRAFCSGNDGSGTHSSKEIHTFDAQLSDGVHPVRFEKVELDERIRNEFIKPYKQPKYRLFIRNMDKIIQYYFRKR